MNRKIFIKETSIAASGLLLFSSCKTSSVTAFEVPVSLQQELYDKALEIAKSKIRGGPGDPVFKRPFVDAAFSSNIFYWDTCFIAAYAKYHQDELPIRNALDNFYNLMEPDGFICREYTREGKPMWPRDHPVSVNPPLLAFAELQLFSVSNDKERLRSVYPKLKIHFDHWIKTWQGTDKLFFNDALGSGMDNIDRFPPGWEDDHTGIAINNLHPEIFNYGGLSAAWNRQGRMVDTSAQMALFAKNMVEIGELINNRDDHGYFTDHYNQISSAINQFCWNETDAFYYDLGYGKQIKRKHIGMFWVLIAEVIPVEKLPRFLAHLKSKKEFWRKIPLATTSADEPSFSSLGDYWRGSVWAPTNYMALLGLLRYNQKELAQRLAAQYYWAVADVFKHTGTFWENYAPDRIEQGNNSRKDFCGWTGIVPITIYREFIKSIQK